MQSSLRVIRDNPRLLLFPVVSTVCTLALALFFFSPLILLGIGAARGVKPDWEGFGQTINQVFYVYGVVVYLVSMFVATFFNVAFYNEIIRALAGEPVSFEGGLKFAMSKWRSVLMWSLLAATVGLVIRAIQERLGWVGKFVMGLIGVAWSVAAVFAIPVIIRREDSNPLSVLRDSAATLKRTWGESLAGFVGIRLAGLAFLALTLAFGVIELVALVVFHQVWLSVAGFVLWLVALMVFGFLTNMATHVYRCALYVYASEGVVPGAFTAEMMNAGWKIKKA